MVCLLLLSLVAPLWWAGQLQPPPRRVRPVEGFTVTPVPYETAPVVSTPNPDEHWIEAPPLLPVVREEPQPQAETAGLADAFDTLAQRLADAQSQPQPADDGRYVVFGPLVADEFDANAEVFPPCAPEGLSSEDDQHRLGRGPRQFAMRAALESRNEQQQVATVWPRPHALVESLQAIAGEARSERWARDVLQALDRLANVPSIESAQSEAQLRKLDELAREVDGFIRRVRPVEQLELVRSTRDALQRRVRVWRQVRRLAARNVPTQFVSRLADDELAREIRQAMATIPGTKAPPAWNRYLGIDALEEALAKPPLDVYQRAAFASFTLDRLHSPRLDKRQRELLDNSAFDRLERTLRAAATQPIENLDVLYAIEQYEQSRTPTDGHRLAVLAARLRWSTDEAVAKLARRIDADYRAANVRLAITEDFFNRSLPPAHKATEDVDEQVLNAYVAGEREVETQLSVKLTPDAEHWRIMMHAAGKMTSDTTSYAGNASLFTQGVGKYSASKLILVDRHHINVWPAKSEASYEGDLYGASTSMDGIPLLSRIARNTAAEGYYQSQWAAHREIEARLKKRAADQLNKQARAELEQADDRITKRVLLPLERTSVEAIPTHLSTTAERVVGEYRLAGIAQLGGHTARPWAPENALLSMQMHETAINNIIVGLRLDGRQAHIRDLFPELYGVFGRDDYEISDAIPDDVTVLFAAEDAVRVSLQEGRMEVILQLAELRTEKRVWRDLIVRNYYAPDTSSLEARLVRDSTVRLKGKRLGTRDQIALRGIFTKVFGDNNEFPIIPAELVDGAGLEGLAVTQFVIRDGWLGVAIAPPHRGLRLGAAPARREARRADVIFD